MFECLRNLLRFCQIKIESSEQGSRLVDGRVLRRQTDIAPNARGLDLLHGAETTLIGILYLPVFLIGLGQGVNYSLKRIRGIPVFILGVSPLQKKAVKSLPM